jgi:hypothetical protein
MLEAKRNVLSFYGLLSYDGRQLGVWVTKPFDLDQAIWISRLKSSVLQSP